jgi:hypothetical protein
MNHLQRIARRRTVGGLCLLIAVTASLSFASGCRTAATGNRRNRTNEFLTQKARESGGDFSKLSAEDQAKAQKLTLGHGPEAIRARAGR